MGLLMRDAFAHSLHAQPVSVQKVNKSKCSLQVKLSFAIRENRGRSLHHARGAEEVFLKTI